MALLLWLLQCCDIKREWNADNAEGKSGKRNSRTKERVEDVERGRTRWEMSHWVCGSCPGRKKERLEWGQCQMHGDTCRDQHASRVSHDEACAHTIWVCVFACAYGCASVGITLFALWWPCLSFEPCCLSASLSHTNTDVNMNTHLSVIVSLSPLATPFITVLAFGVRTTWDTKKVPFLLHETQFHFVLFFSYLRREATDICCSDCCFTFELCLHRTKNTKKKLHMHIYVKNTFSHYCQQFPLNVCMNEFMW